VEINQFSTALAASDAVVDLPVTPLPTLASDAGEAVKELAAMAAGEFASLGGGNAGVRVRVFCQNDGECSRLRELIAECAPLAADRIGIESRYLHRGFIWGAQPAETAAGPEGPI